MERMNASLRSRRRSCDEGKEKLNNQPSGVVSMGKVSTEEE
jgi:hypothetical protein